MSSSIVSLLAQGELMLKPVLGPPAEYIMSSPYVCYGAGPVVAAFLGFILPYLFILLLEKIGMVSEKDSITYNGKNRKVAQAILEKKVSTSEQFRASLWTTMGPGALGNGLLSAFLLPHLFPALNEIPALPDLNSFLAQQVIMQLVGDLLLYAGHRIQHENTYLWKNFHSVHHSIDTPTVASTAYIHAIDMTLQTALPMMIAAVCAQAHPISFLFYIFARVGENAINHCGYNHWLINLVSLKFMPLKASVKHHDQHHKYSNYGGNAKNYAENWMIWDWLFGTYRA